MKSSLSYLNEVIGKNRYFILALTVFLSVYSLSGIAYALLFKRLADYAIESSYVELKNSSFMFFALLIFQSVLNAIIRMMQERCDIRIQEDLRKRVLKDIFERDYASIKDVHSGEWMNKFTNDINVISRNAVHLLPNYCSIILQILVSVFVMIRLFPSLTFLLLLLVGVAFIFDAFFYHRIRDLHKRVQEKDGDLRVFLQEHLNSLAIVKAYGKSENVLSDFDIYQKDLKDARIRKNNYSVIMNFFFGTGVNGTLILSGIYCAYAIMNKRISYGTFIAMIQIVTLLRNPIASAYVGIPNFYSMIGSIERLKTVHYFSYDTNGKQEHCSFEKICFDKVSFQYPGTEKEVFHDLSLIIENGSFTGILGPSGCGKSTLFKLLLCLYKPSAGEITVDDVTLDSSFRDLFAYVPQTNLLMKGSIKNVVCFYEDYDEKRFNEALRVSACDEFINELPEGIETQLKEKGSGLSEGQLQRIAIARAIYSRRPVLLLDEVTSALNEELELKILTSLRSMKDKTVLLITHRRKAMEYADQLIVCKEEGDGYTWMI